MKKVLFSLLFLLCAFAYAAMPEDSVIIEAESMTCPNNAWSKRPHYTGYYGGYPSGGAHLMGANQTPGTASCSINIEKPGKYNLWTRYLDMSANRANAGFVLTVKHKGVVVATGEFDKTSMRAGAEGQKKWGKGYAIFVWDKLPLEAAEAGEYTLELTKLKKGAVTTAAGRHLDLFLLTQNLTFEPRITELHPLFFRVKMLEGQTQPVALHLFGLRSHLTPGGWYIPHANLNKKGFFIGPDNGAGNMMAEHFKAGDVSQWVELTPYLTYLDYDRLQFYAITGYHRVRPATADFELQFAHAPSEDKILKTFRRTGRGHSIQVAVNLRTDDIVSEIDASEASGKYAAAAGNVEGRMPVRFPMSTGSSVAKTASTQIAFENEVKALHAIGINSLGTPFAAEDFPLYRANHYCFHLTKGRCLQQPDEARLKTHFKNLANNVKKAGAPQPYVLNLMDEPGLPIAHINGCAYCKAQFPEYLKRMGVSLEPATFTDKPADGLRYYWSMRYARAIVPTMVTAASKAAAEYFPSIPTTVNFATSLVYSGTMGTCDWFELLSPGRLTFGWGEDWANHSRSYQVNGYYVDVLRAASARSNVPFGMYDILSSRSEWEIVAKAYMHIGHGCKALGFHNYGPWYMASTDANNQRPEIYSAIKKVAFPTGAIEDELLASQVPRGDAAQLFSATCDIWNNGKYNPFGQERIHLNLLLRHCNFRLDTLHEDDLKAQLANYKLLVASDSHIKKENAAVILDWIKNGGTLYLTGGALQFDEANAPLPLRKELGVQEPNFKITNVPETAQHGMFRLKALAKHENMELISGVQEPLHQVVKLGKGQVISDGFLPGISYMGRVKPVKGAVYSVLDYPEAHRKYIASLPFPVKPLLATDNYRVEVNLLTGPKSDIIVLSNWTGQETTVTVSFPGKYRSLKPVNCTLLAANGPQAKVTLGAGGYLVGEK